MTNREKAIQDVAKNFGIDGKTISEGVARIQFADVLDKPNYVGNEAMPQSEIERIAKKNSHKLQDSRGQTPLPPVRSKSNINFCVSLVAIIVGTAVIYYSTTPGEVLIGCASALLGLGVAVYIIFTEGNRNG